MSDIHNEADSRYSILTRNTTWIYISKIVTQVFGFVVSILVIRKLSVEVYGTFNFLVATFVLFKLFTISPVVDVLNRFIPELTQVKDYRRLKIIILYSLMLSTAALAGLLVLVYFFNRPFAVFFKIDNFRTYYYPFIFYVILSIFRDIIVTIVTSLILHKYLAIFRIALSFLTPIVYFAFLPVLNVKIMLFIEGSLALVIIIPSLLATIRFIRVKRHSTKDGDAGSAIKKRVLRFGILASFNELGAGIVGKTSDYFIISAIGSQYHVGLFSFAYKIFQIVYKILPLKDFQTILRPLYFQKFSGDHSRDEFIQVYNFIAKVMMPVFMFPALYFILFGRSVISYIYDPKYLDAYWVTCIILLSGIEVAFFYPLTLTIHLKERMEIPLYSKVIVVFSILAGILGMKYFGIIGVAVATSAGSILKKLFMHFMMRKKAAIVYRYREFMNYLIIPVFLYLVFFYIQRIISTIWELIVFSLLFFIVSLLLFILYHPYNDRDLGMIRQICESSAILRKIKPVVMKIYGLKPRWN